MKRNCLSVLLLACLFFACKKDHDNPPVPPPPPAPKTMKINFSTDRTGIGTSELIISEPGGKTLLDTLSPFGQIVATLQTDKTLLDVTIIDSAGVPSPGSGGATYNARIFRSVNPSTWTTFNTNGYVVPYPGTQTEKKATIYLKNLPPVSLSGIQVIDYISPFAATLIDQGPGYASLSYDQLGTGSNLSVLLPDPGLYTFYHPKSVTDTVDVSRMDTAVKLNFNKPASYVMDYTILYVIPDTTDLSQSMTFYNSTLNPPGLPDVEYPRKGVQKMELNAAGTDSSNGFSASYYSYGATIPTSLPFPDASSMTLSTIRPEGFSVKFSSSYRPSYLLINGHTGKTGAIMYCSPDSANVDLKTFLNTLHSKLLTGQNFSDIIYTSCYSENVGGIDYLSFNNNSHDPANSKRVPFAISLSKIIK